MSIKKGRGASIIIKIGSSSITLSISPAAVFAVFAGIALITIVKHSGDCSCPCKECSGEQ
ncbi:MAG: hypothetical protein IJ561_08090 [Ruminococcus sp.]|nr:hypothetical protein [Ruminococcus sp.]